LSQPEIVTSASKQCAPATSSIESATSSRDTSEARIPAVPIVIPSEIAIVFSSIGVPPAERIPSFTFAASTRLLKLHGIVSIHECATPTIGLERSSAE
jgi:hypothetical protein